MTAAVVLLFISFSLRLAIVAARRDRHVRPLVTPEPPPPRPRTHDSLATVTDGELVKLVGRARGTTIASALTGRACVAYLSRAQVWHSRKIPQLIEDLRDAKGTFVLEGFAPSSDFEEALIEDGDEVAVSGIVVRDAVEAAGYRELPRQRRRFIAHARHPVTVALP